MWSSYTTSRILGVILSIFKKYQEDDSLKKNFIKKNLQNEILCNYMQIKENDEIPIFIRLLPTKLLMI